MLSANSSHIRTHTHVHTTRHTYTHTHTLTHTRLHTHTHTHNTHYTARKDTHTHTHTPDKPQIHCIHTSHNKHTLTHTHKHTHTHTHAHTPAQFPGPAIGGSRRRRTLSFLMLSNTFTLCEAFPWSLFHCLFRPSVPPHTHTSRTNQHAQAHACTGARIHTYRTSCKNTHARVYIQRQTQL